MKISTPIFALCMIAGTAQAQSIVDQLCGVNHIDQIASFGDVAENPDGYYIQSLQTQLSHGDPRIVQAVGDTFHLCTRSAATPDMDSSRVITLNDRHVVKFLFVPIGDRDLPGS